MMTAATVNFVSDIIKDFTALQASHLQAYPRLHPRRRSLRPMMLATTALCCPLLSSS